MKAEIVEIPRGVTRISLMRMSTGDLRPDRGTDESGYDGFPLFSYERIGTLIIPESVDIPHETDLSPFAAHEQYPFVYNFPIKCNKLLIDRIENHSPNLVVEDGVLYSSDKHRLIFCFEEKTSFIIPQSVTTIEPFAFCMQRGLREISFHDGIVSIESSCFMGCDSLEEIVLPRKIKCIPWSCFDGCESLRSVTLPPELETISHAAFRNCRALAHIELPASLKAIDGFEGCSSLREIEIPAGVERIEVFMFCSSLRKVRLHEGVRNIAGYAFRYCDNLTKINFPEGLQTIGERAFYPSSLKRIAFPESLQEIGDEAFYYNRKLCLLSFSSKETKIGKAAFACCPLLIRKFIVKPRGLKIDPDVFNQDKTFDKFAFWD